MPLNKENKLREGPQRHLENHKYAVFLTTQMMTTNISIKY